MPRKAGGTPEPSARGASEQKISFGMVNVPVKVANLEKSRARSKISANFICPLHEEKLVNQRYCAEGDHIVEDAVKGYPTESGYVVLDDDVVEQLVADKTSEFKIESFVDLAEIDPLYFGKSLMVWPDASTSTYDLLGAGMKAAGVAGVGNAIFGRSKSTQMIILRWSEAAGCLVAHVCLYDSEIRWDDINLIADAAAARPDPPQAEIDMAMLLIDQKAGDFDPTAVTDTYQEELEELLTQAAAGKMPVAPAAKPAPTTQAVDLMEALRESVEAAKAAKKPAKRTAKKKAVA